MENTWQVQKADGAWLFQIVVQSTKQGETILSVIKRLFGEHITSRLVRTENRELSFKCIAYNMHRLTNLIITINGFY